MSSVVSLVFLGAGGHARVLREAILAANSEIESGATRLAASGRPSLTKYDIVGYYNDAGATWADVKYLGTMMDASMKKGTTDQVAFVCAIGDNATRQRIVEQMAQVVRTWATVLHPSAIVSPSATLAPGAQILAHAVLNTSAAIGAHAIINTSASVDHDCRIGAFAHIAPGVHLCGDVRVDSGALVGVGVSVIPKMHVGARAIVGAGAIVLTDVPHDTTVFGVVSNTSLKSTSSATAATSKTAVVPASSAAGSSSRISWLPQKNIDWASVQKHLAQSITRNHFSNGGPCVKALEHHLMTVFGIEDHKTAILINNGTSAIHALVSAFELQLKKVHKFATQSFTFPASAQGACAGALIVDIDAGGGLDLAAVDPATVDGIIVTNCFGHLTDLDMYENWCAVHGKFLIFDNAATSMSEYVHVPRNSSVPLRPRNSLNFGTAATVSFHHTKPAGFGEGGLIVVDKRWEAAIRQVMNFGFDVPKGDVQWQPQGNNYKMSDVQAAFIMSYLEDLPTIVAEHARVYEEIARRLTKMAPYATLFPNRSSNTPFASCVPIVIASSVSEELVVRLAKQFAIDLRKYYKPLDGSLPVSASLYGRIVCFPCHRDMREEQLDRVETIIREIVLAQQQTPGTPAAQATAQAH